jgi:hypothetical protein
MGQHSLAIQQRTRTCDFRRSVMLGFDRQSLPRLFPTIGLVSSFGFLRISSLGSCRETLSLASCSYFEIAARAKDKLQMSLDDVIKTDVSLASYFASAVDMHTACHTTFLGRLCSLPHFTQPHPTPHSPRHITMCLCVCVCACVRVCAHARAISVTACIYTLA